MGPRLRELAHRGQLGPEGAVHATYVHLRGPSLYFEVQNFLHRGLNELTVPNQGGRGAHVTSYKIDMYALQIIFTLYSYGYPYGNPYRS